MLGERELTVRRKELAHETVKRNEPGTPIPCYPADRPVWSEANVRCSGSEKRGCLRDGEQWAVSLVRSSDFCWLNFASPASELNK